MSVTPPPSDLENKITTSKPSIPCGSAPLCQLRWSRLVIIGLVLWSLYGSVASPAEAGGVGALFCIVLVMANYQVWWPRALCEILRTAMRESVMLMLSIGMGALLSYMMSPLYFSRGFAERFAVMEVTRWLLLIFVNMFLLVRDFPRPVAGVLMAIPTLLPISTRVGFDPSWFGVVFTGNIEIGPVTPPVGLDLHVINGITPDVNIPAVLLGGIAVHLMYGAGYCSIVRVPGHRGPIARLSDGGQ